MLLINHIQTFEFRTEKGYYTFSNDKNAPVQFRPVVHKEVTVLMKPEDQVTQLMNFKDKEEYKKRLESDEQFAEQEEKNFLQLLGKHILQEESRKESNLEAKNNFAQKIFEWARSQSTRPTELLSSNLAKNMGVYFLQHAIMQVDGCHSQNRNFCELSQEQFNAIKSKIAETGRLDLSNTQELFKMNAWLCNLLTDRKEANKQTANVIADSIEEHNLSNSYKEIVDFIFSEEYTEVKHKNLLEKYTNEYLETEKSIHTNLKNKGIATQFKNSEILDHVVHLYLQPLTPFMTLRNSDKNTIELPEN